MEGGKDYIREKHWEDKVPLEKIYNLNNGVDLQEFDQNCQQYRLDDPDLLDESTFKVVYTGSIRLVNNLGKIVEMAEYLQKQGENKIKFLLYGDGTEREQLMQLCKQKGLTNIRFPGKVEKSTFRSSFPGRTSISTTSSRRASCALDAASTSSLTTLPAASRCCPI